MFTDPEDLSQTVAPPHSRMTEKLLARAQELVAIGTFLIDRATGTIHVSAEMARLLRAGDVPFDLPLPEYRRRFIHPEDLAEAVGRIEQSYAEDRPLIMEARVVRGDGTVSWARVASSVEKDEHGAPLIVGVFQDITEQKRAEQGIREQEQHLRDVAEKLELRNWALAAYANAADALRSASSAGELVQAVCDSITRERSYVLCWVGLVEEGPGKQVRRIGASGPGLSYLDNLSISWSETEPNGQGPTGRSIRNKQTERLDDIESADYFGPWRERARRLGIKSSISVPMISGDKVVGALVVYAPAVAAFGDVEVALFERLASEIAHGLRSLQSYQDAKEQRGQREEAQRRLAEALEATITAMSSTMEQRDPYTAGHERRVADIAVSIAAELGWNADQLQGLRMASLVHDIGKISVPLEILTKPGRLNAAEFEIVKQHAEAGYLILKDIPFPWPVARMVREHHERLDGTGYPLRLKGDQMLPESRILAIADMLEAMASHRPYRPSRGVDFALKQIESEAGTTLDAAGVAACLKLYRDQGRPLPT